MATPINPKFRAFLLGALEALGVGFVLGVGTVWLTPNDIVFTRAALVTAVSTGAKFGIIYLGGYLRMNRAFSTVAASQPPVVAPPVVAPPVEKP